MRDLLSAIETRLDSATSRGLATAVERAISDGVLAPGSKLPPIRHVAAELAISPSTVTAAWNLLSRSGQVRTDGRRGTTVLDQTNSLSGRYSQVVGPALDLDLSSGIPAAELLPSLAGVVATLDQMGTPSSYLDHPVLPELSDLLADDWAYPSPPALSIVDGAMDALDLLTRTALRIGDRVIVEHPCFPPILDLLETLSVDVVGVPIDADGLNLTALEAALPASAVILQPRAQNPTGVTMSAERAEAIAALLSDKDTIIIEDDSFHGLASGPSVSLGRWLPAQTVHIRSFSKSHGPDLRLAAMSGPQELLRRIDARRHLGQGWSSRLLQRILLGLLTDPSANHALATAREVYQDRRTRVVGGLAEHGITVGGTEGINIWVPVRDEPAAIIHLANEGIGASAGAPFNVLTTRERHIRVTCGLIRQDHDEVAAAIAAAARASSRSGRGR